MTTPDDFQRLEEDVRNTVDPLHAGFDLSRALSAAPEHDTHARIAVTQEWARGKVEAYGIRLGTKNYETMMRVAEALPVKERQAYLRNLFLMCVE